MPDLTKVAVKGLAIDPNSPASKPGTKNGAFTQSGGFSRFQLGEVHPEPTDAEMRVPQINHNVGGGRMTVRDGAAVYEELGVTRHFAGDGAPEGILGAGRTLAGGVLSGPGDVKDSTLFTWKGVEMSAVSAARIGLLVRLGPDQYALPGQPAQPAAAAAAPTAQPEAKADAPVEGAGFALDERAEESLKMVSAIAGSDEAATQLALSAIRHGVEGNLQAAIDETASRLGMEPEAAASVVNGLVESIRSSAVAHLTKLGEPGEEVLSWAESAFPAAVRRELSVRVLNGDPAAFLFLRDSYRQAKFLQAVKNQGR